MRGFLGHVFGRVVNIVADSVASSVRTGKDIDEGKLWRAVVGGVSDASGEWLRELDMAIAESKRRSEEAECTLRMLRAREEAVSQAYSILGVKRTASGKEIRAAYIKLSKVEHPDAGGSEDGFKRLGWAYGIVKEHREHGSKEKER